MQPTILPLSFSSSTITVYKNTTGAQGIKPSALTAYVTITAADGQVMEEPYTNDNPGVVFSTANEVAKASWPMSITASYATVGQHDVALLAGSTTGAVYGGTLVINVVSLPTFSLTNSDIYASIQRGTTNTADFTPLNYAAVTDTPAPTLSISTLSGPPENCTGGSSYTASAVVCSDPGMSSLGDGTSEMEFTFQNQYQLITIAGGLIVSN